MANIEITPELLADTRAKAEAATQDEWPYDASYLMEDSDMAYVFRVMNIYDVSYIAAVNPQVVLALIAEIEDLRSWLKAQGEACCECQEVEAELRKEIENLRQERQILRDHLKKAVKEND